MTGAQPHLLRVLIVDDSPEDTDTITRALRRWPDQPVAVRTAMLGEDALTELRDWAPDLLLLDYQLPDMTGLEFLAQARPACAVIVMTGLGDERVAVQALQAGAQDYLAKGQLKPEDLWRAGANAVERHALERDLRREQERNRAILNSITDGFLACDAQLTVQYANPAAERLLGLHREALLGHALTDALPWRDGVLDGILHRTVTPGQTLGAELHVPRTGLWLGVRLFPVGNGLNLYFGDITARVERHERERQATARLRQLYDASLALNTALLPDDMHTLIVTQAREVLGAHAAALALALYPGQQPVLHLVATAGETSDLPVPPAPLSRDHPLTLTPEPAGVPGRWLSLPLLRDGEPLGVLGVVLEHATPSVDERTLLLTYAELCAQALDRASLAEAEREHRHTLERRVQERTASLERSNRELEQFAYVASHDLKEPLRTVSSFAQLLQSRHGAQLDERGVRYLDIVIDGAQRMFTLIEDVLAMARVSHAAAPRPVQLGPLVRDVLTSLDSLCRETGAQVTVHPLPTVQGDPTQFAQLFQNLLGNALKFRREGVTPRVQVSAERDGSGWLFRVEDNGIGIEQQYLQQVFTVFQRLHTRQVYAGNGIGLSVCQKIVEGRGGHIWLESQPGHGTTVLFTLPGTGSLAT